MRRVFIRILVEQALDEESLTMRQVPTLNLIDLFPLVMSAIDVVRKVGEISRIIVRLNLIFQRTLDTGLPDE